MSVETLTSRRPFLTRAQGIGALAQDLSRYVSYFLICLSVARQRRRLLTLDEKALKDIGVSSVDAFREANRSFWDIPEDLKPHNPTGLERRNPFPTHARG